MVRIVDPELAEERRRVRVQFVAFMVLVCAAAAVPLAWLIDRAQDEVQDATELSGTQPCTEETRRALVASLDDVERQLHVERLHRGATCRTYEGDVVVDFVAAPGVTDTLAAFDAALVSRGWRPIGSAHDVNFIGTNYWAERHDVAMLLEVSARDRATRVRLRAQPSECPRDLCHETE